MQANCLVFPSPLNYNISPISRNIVLIPQTTNENQKHLVYENYLRLCSYRQQIDLFEAVINKLTMNKSNRIQKQSQNRILNQSLKRLPTNQTNTSQKIQHILSMMQHRLQKKQHGLQKKQPRLQKKQHELQKKQHELYSKQYILQEKQYGLQNIQKNQHILQRFHATIPSLSQNSPLISYSIPCQQLIPCLFLPGSLPKIIVFFHANAQDITSAYQFLKMINNQTHYSILAMEYRGYSISKGETNPMQITSDAQNVINYLLNRGVSNQQIVVFGRSIGSAIALKVLENTRVYAVVLLSPFLSLKKVAKELYGNCAGWALKQGFNNQQSALNIACPLLLIHGMKDPLVPYHHSLSLFAHCKSFCQLKLIQNMTHSRFNFRSDFIRHFQLFMKDLQESIQN